MTELQLIKEKLESASCPEDVFGYVNPVQVKRSFQRLARTVHPDFHDNSPTSKQAFQLLSEIHHAAEGRIKEGTWGQRIPLPHAVPIQIGPYEVKRKPIAGHIADVFISEYFVVKVAKTHNDNDLMRAEQNALQAVGKVLPAQIREGIPTVKESLTVAGEGGWKRLANVMPRYSGFLTAEEVHKRKPSIDTRTLIWMFKRLLVLLEWVHHAGYIHGAILPPHVMFYPDNDGNDATRDARKHSVRLIDWCYAVDYKNRTRLSAWVPVWKEHYPPEMLSKNALSQASDLYMAAKLMKYLAGSSSIPASILAILDRCMESEYGKRFSSAVDVYEAWTASAKAELGPPVWHEFNI